ncbi:hypothetical protein [Maribacter sp. 2-571]|uniref:DUF7738 domain-containing protein n=1 Tax=Maribacter sp. 2-571 TaxID=3417569 RepID=UPI003D34FFFD
MSGPIRNLFLFLFPLLLTSCFGQQKQPTEVIDGESEKPYKELKAKDTPEVRERLAAFNAQEHRLEFSGCEMRYNGKSFFLGDTLEEVEAVLGKHDYNRGIGFSWSHLNLEVFLDDDTKIVSTIYLYLHRVLENVMTPNDKYKLISGVPLNQKMVFKDFLESSNYTFNDIRFSKYNYNFEVKKCNKGGEKLKLYFRSSVPYKVKDAGHIQLRGEFDPQSTNPVDLIVFRYQNEDID